MPEGHTLHRLAPNVQELVCCELLASTRHGRFAAGVGNVFRADALLRLHVIDLRGRADYRRPRCRS